MSENVELYLQSKKWNYAPAGDQYRLTICPVCGDEKEHFYIHQKIGLWKCHKCNVTGNLFTLRKHMGDVQAAAHPLMQAESAVVIDPGKVDAYCKNLVPGTPAWDYLQSRGITIQAIMHFKLGVGYEGNATWLTIPYRKANEYLDIKYRTLPPAKKAFKKIPDAIPCLFNEEAIRDAKDVIVVEGELDCISLWQLGYTNVVSVPFGADSLQPEHWDVLNMKETLYLLFDGDPAGKKGAKKIADRLDPSRCREVVLPGMKDANAFIRSGGTKEELDYLLEHAEAYGGPRVYSARKALLELSDTLEQTGQIVEGPTYPWKSVGDIFGVMGRGEVTVVLGAAGVGKTTYVMQTLTHVAKTQQVPSMLMCLEMPVSRLTQLLVAQTVVCDRGNLKPEHTVRAMAALYKVPFYLASRPPEMTWDVIRNILVGAIRRFGIQVWAFDNIQFLCRGVNMVQEVGLASQRLRMLADETNTHAIVVSHPRKPKDGAMQTQYDAAWSQAISADADHMHVVFRKPLKSSDHKVKEVDFEVNIPVYEDRTMIDAAKSRYTAGGRAILHLHGPSGLFMEQAPVRV